MQLEKYVAEFIGTAIFLTIILKSKGDTYVIVLGLLAAILFMGSISGGHFNPAVSIMQYVNKEMVSSDLFGYIIGQILGGLIAIKIASLH
jgi:aquaporin Z